MPEYRVRWEIEVDAETPREAVENALEIHRDLSSIATVFEVAPRSGGPFQRIDLLEESAVADREADSSAPAGLEPADAGQDQDDSCRRWALYDFNAEEMLSPTYGSYQEAVEDLDPCLTSVVVVSFHC